MSIVVTDTGFAPDDWQGGKDTVELTSETLPEEMVGELPTLRMIRVRFDGFADGRGFSIARRLRLLGYGGRLRAVGHVLADQYAMARRAGFDEVEIDEDLAARQPREQWLSRADWRAHDYQMRLRAPSSARNPAQGS